MLPRIPVVRVRASGVRVAIWPLDNGAVWNRQAATDLRVTHPESAGVGGRQRNARARVGRMDVQPRVITKQQRKALREVRNARRLLHRLKAAATAGLPRPVLNPHEQRLLKLIVQSELCPGDIAQWLRV